MATTIICLLFSAFVFSHMQMPTAAVSPVSRLGAEMAIKLSQRVTGLKGTCKSDWDALFKLLTTDKKLIDLCNDLKTSTASITNCAKAVQDSIKKDVCDCLGEVKTVAKKEITDLLALKLTSNCKTSAKLPTSDTDWQGIDRLCDLSTANIKNFSTSLPCTKDEYSKVKDIACSASTLLAGVVSLVVFLFTHLVTNKL